MDQSDFENLLARYSYSFPAEAIATAPASPRDSARLLTYNRKNTTVGHHVFRDLPELLPKNALLVLNDTKVIPARIICTRVTGGKVELLYIRTQGERVLFLANKKFHEGEELFVDTAAQFIVRGREGKQWVLEPTFPVVAMVKFLEAHGVTPIPPYIKHTPLGERLLREEYQTVFAREQGSVAAPTASLHFTNQLMGRLTQSGIDIARITLHVGLGTFAPLTKEAVERNALHEEFYSISEDTAREITLARSQNRPIIAVGTTVVRALESACNEQGVVRPGLRSTNIFICPEYTFNIINGMITNFHVPASSLLMLVAAFIGRERVLKLYKDAIEKKYRLFSFGDAMLLL